MMFEIGESVGPFIEKEVQDGKVGRESEAVAEDLRIGVFQTKRIVGLLLPLRVDEGAQVRFQFPNVCGGLGPLAGDLHQPAEGLEKLLVECCQQGEGLLVKWSERILIIEEVGTAVIGGHDGAPVVALPGCPIVDAGLRDRKLFVPVDDGYGKRDGAVACQDAGAVTEALFLKMFTIFQLNILF